MACSVGHMEGSQTECQSVQKQEWTHATMCCSHGATVKIKVDQCLSTAGLKYTHSKGLILCNIPFHSQFDRTFFYDLQFLFFMMQNAQ